MGKHPAKRGFLPDFSCYLERDYPIADAYEDATLINSLGDFLKCLVTAQNPLVDLKTIGCHVEKMDRSGNKDDKKFIKKCSTASVAMISQVYYVSFGNNPKGMAFGIDSTARIAYIFAVDRHHRIRAWHGKLG